MRNQQKKKVEAPRSRGCLTGLHAGPPFIARDLCASQFPRESYNTVLHNPPVKGLQAQSSVPPALQLFSSPALQPFSSPALSSYIQVAFLITPPSPRADQNGS